MSNEFENLGNNWLGLPDNYNNEDLINKGNPSSIPPEIPLVIDEGNPSTPPPSALSNE
jgi:hypothetical protein